MTAELKHRFLESEKSHISRINNQLVVITSRLVTKKQIKSFIEQKYDVKISKVNSILSKGKSKVRRKMAVKLPDKKKFYIRISEGLEKFNKVDDKDA